MTHYTAPNKIKKEQLPPPQIGYSFFTIGGLNGVDTVRILFDTVRDLVELSLLAQQPTDSISIVSLIKGKNFLVLNAAALKEANIVKPWMPLDFILSKGKQFTLDSLFTKKGTQKTNLERPQQAYLIDALSNWGMFVFWDDYSGSYRIKESNDFLE